MAARPRHRMPQDVRERLQQAKLMEAYELRPPYQRNDYLGWILRAKRPDTRERRVLQMLDELRGGRLYMKMEYSARLPD